MLLLKDRSERKQSRKELKDARQKHEVKTGFKITEIIERGLDVADLFSRLFSLSMATSFPGLIINIIIIIILFIMVAQHL